MPIRDPWTPNSPASSDSSPASSSSSNNKKKESLLPVRGGGGGGGGGGPATTTTTTTTRKRPGQTKSRTGCYSCKRRKVKCNEHWPECDNCKRLKLDCVYPWAKKMMAGREQQSSSAGQQPSTPLRTTPTALTLEDLRFYHFFMTTCYPRWPADPVAQRIWGQAAAMSSNFECLAHAILALGATFLTASGNVDHSHRALQHRTSAISLVNQRFATSAHSMDTAEGDALIGAVICLSAQAAVTADGWSDFFTLNRGIVLMHMTCIKDPSKSIFTMLDHGNGTEGRDVPPEYLREPPPATLAIFRVYKGCLLLLRPHVRTQEEKQYFNHLWSISEVLGTPRLSEAWKTFEALNLMMFMMSPERHAKFVHEDNRVAQILATYTGAADFLMRWGPLVPDVPPDKGKDDYVMRQAANQRAIASLLRKRAEGLPLKFAHSKVAMTRLSDDLAAGVGVRPSSSSSPRAGDATSAWSPPPVGLL